MKKLYEEKSNGRKATRNKRARRIAIEMKTVMGFDRFFTNDFKTVVNKGR
jgi:hypothetical protein